MEVEQRSAYELERAANMRSNEAHLHSLGLGLLTAPTQSRAHKKRLVGPAATQAPVRKSARTVPAQREPGERTAEPRQLLVPWYETVFRELADEEHSDGATLFDRKKTHQHLTISPSGRVVATTGVAGYGAALCKRGSDRSTAEQHWEVRAVRFGVGGFGVGVVRAAMRPPYKSLGKTPEAVGVYLAGGNLAMNGSEREFGPPYEPGDRIGVVLRRTSGSGNAGKRDLVFLRNGVEVGVGATGLDPVGLVLAVQPYMGGVAQLRN